MNFLFEIGFLTGMLVTTLGAYIGVKLAKRAIKKLESEGNDNA